MRSLTECAKCHRKPTVVPSGKTAATWHGAAAAPSNVDFSAPGLETTAGACNRVGGVSHNTLDGPSMCHETTQPRSLARVPSVSGRASAPKKLAHPDKVDRIKMECQVCGYKSFPQWMNDRAHCLKCDAVLKTRQSCQEHRGESRSRHNAAAPEDAEEQPTPSRPSPMGTRCGLRARHDIRNAFHQLDVNCDGVISQAELKGVLQKLPVPEGDEAFDESDFESIFEDMDENNDGVIDYHEFTNWVMQEGFGAPEIMQRVKLWKASLKAGSDSAARNDTSSSAGLNTPSDLQRKQMNECSEFEMTQFPNLLNSSSGFLSSSLGAPKLSTSKSQIRGPERFFYDKSSYTGTHACGGPDHVAKGGGTAVDQSWKRRGS